MAELQQATERVKPDPESRERFVGQRVLVVEDHPINQQVVQAQLEQMGLNVELASDGAQGVQRVRDEAFDLVLMDIQMPVMDGYQATIAIRQFNTVIPIIALTAAALVEDREKALACGMNDHLGKPFSNKQLFNILKSWLKTVSPEQMGCDQGVVQMSRDLGGLSVSQSAPEPMVKRDLPTVLIVDDVVANIKLLVNLLKDDYVIQVANGGRQALALVRSDKQPDLILLDIVMPDIDGYEVCRALKSDPLTKDIPIIFVSALDEISDEAKGLSLGAADYIAKPFSAEIIKARIRNHVNFKIKSDMLEEMSHIDALTQVANRRLFNSTMTRELDRLRRAGRSIGLIMADIDCFKAFNDNYGHGKGDECLIKVALALQQTLGRSSDLLARFGGEEFVAILPEADEDMVLDLAEKMRAAVESIDFPHAYSGIASHVTISLGCLSEKVTDQTSDQLLLRVDEALYAAKKQGRNRVCLAGRLEAGVAGPGLTHDATSR